MREATVIEYPDRTGGCLCGDIRFRVRGRPGLVEYCHCGRCRKGSGAPVMAWAGVLRRDFEWTRGTPRIFASSEGVERGFCGRCGTTLSHASAAFPEEMYVSVAALDDAPSLPPEVHIWRCERLPWFDTADSLPRYLRFKADGLQESEAGTPR